MRASEQQRLLSAMHRATDVLQQGLYLHLPYETLFEYLKVLPAAAAAGAWVGVRLGNSSAPRKHRRALVLGSPGRCCDCLASLCSTCS